ncbi:MAG TPA: phage terminase large subunit [Nitrosomonas sp.]|nr:phage terminase large subunit [Nitrosomonas sp.]
MSELYSKPNFSDFSPRVIPYQSDVVDFLDEWDFSSGTPEILLSGSVGSAKSILMAHLIVRHCLENPGARVCLARKALPDLKDTIFKEVLEHISEDFTEGKHYWVNNSSAKITWWNGSEIISRSWADKKYKKARSLKLSMVVFEELTENNDDDKEAFDTLKARLRRIPTVKENILIAATNPDSPGHWVHKYFIDSDKRTRKVFYSVTTDNPFLDPVYIEQLKQDYDPKMARRMLYGEWLEINEERVYHSYDPENNFIKGPYQINNHYPIILAFDFNIGAGKPMSSCAKQWDGRSFHIFDEVIVQGARTEEVADEWIEKGIVKQGQRIIIRGDASGDAKDTRSKLSDYDILRKKFAAVGAIVEFQVPRANPPVRRRHNLVNAYCLNDQGAIRLFVYEKAKTCHEGMRLTALKKGGDYIEDDSKPYQHVTTAIGYSVVYQHNLINTNQVYSSGR